MKNKFKFKGTAESQNQYGQGNTCNNGINPRGFIIIGASPEREMDELELVESIRRYNKTTPIIMIAGNNSEKQISAALEIGVNDLFSWSSPLDGIVESIKKHQLNSPKNRKILQENEGFIVGQSAVMKKLKITLKKIATTESNVLITGETGTGKEIAAEFIHRNSNRKESPLLCINCTAFPDTLLESELFGHEKGAFTSAVTSRQGKFEMASGGTLFLDEIGDMETSAQAKILRAIEKKEIWRIGGDRPYLSDFRLITATNRDPEYMISIGKFREDLYYRLNIARIHIPPLREHPEDIPALAAYAVNLFNHKFKVHIRGVNNDVLSAFRRSEWPGNVRQLNNVIEASYINSPREEITLKDLPEMFLETMKTERNMKTEAATLRSVLDETGWNISKAAKRLCISRMTMYRKMVKYHIVRKN